MYNGIVHLPVGREAKTSHRIFIILLVADLNAQRSFYDKFKQVQQLDMHVTSPGTCCDYEPPTRRFDFKHSWATLISISVRDMHVTRFKQKSELLSG